MSSSIPEITSGLALVAFLAAVGLSAYRAQLKRRLQTIKTLPPETRSAAVLSELNAFGVRADGLSREQQYQLALREIELRRARLFATTLTILVVAILSAFVAFTSLYVGRTPAKAQISSGKIGQEARDVLPPPAQIDRPQPHTPLNPYDLDPARPRTFHLNQIAKFENSVDATMEVVSTASRNTQISCKIVFRGSMMINDRSNCEGMACTLNAGQKVSIRIYQSNTDFIDGYILFHLNGNDVGRPYCSISPSVNLLIQGTPRH